MVTDTKYLADTDTKYLADTDTKYLADTDAMPIPNMADTLHDNVTFSYFNEIIEKQCRICTFII